MTPPKPVAGPPAGLRYPPTVSASVSTEEGRGAAGAQASGAERALPWLFAAAAIFWAWNALSLSPLWGYDGPGHAAYIETLRQGRWPHPLEGWSTFHPPLYYALAALVWRVTEGLGAEATLLGLRVISGASWLATAACIVAALRALGIGGRPVLVCVAVWLGMPCAHMASAMIGNESLAALLAAAATWQLLHWHARADSWRRASALGLLCGLAIATKVSAVFVAGATIVTLLAYRDDRRVHRAFAALVLVSVAVAGPVLLRNWSVAGTPLPMARDHEPMKSTEASQVIREREIGDYLWLDPRTLSYPSLYLDRDRRLETPS